MKHVGEMGFVIGFDGPILGDHLPTKQRRLAALDLILESLTLPVDHWATFDEGKRRLYKRVAEDIADELLALSKTFRAVRNDTRRLRSS